MNVINHEVKKFQWVDLIAGCEDEAVVTSTIAIFDVVGNPKSVCIGVCADDPYGIVVLTEEKNPQVLAVLKEEDLRRQSLVVLIERIALALQMGVHPYPNKITNVSIVMDDVHTDMGLETLRSPLAILPHAVKEYFAVARFIEEVSDSPYATYFENEIEWLKTSASHRDGKPVYDFLGTEWPKLHAYTTARRYIARLYELREGRCQYSSRNVETPTKE